MSVLSTDEWEVDVELMQVRHVESGVIFQFVWEQKESDSRILNAVVKNPQTIPPRMSDRMIEQLLMEGGQLLIDHLSGR
ncbi:MAG: hypothetical protein HQL56_12995 [Magnetococcales bacterium]|nr:hypothetical protein [Magnetococcales bacterium]